VFLTKKKIIPNLDFFCQKRLQNLFLSRKNKMASFFYLVKREEGGYFCPRDIMQKTEDLVIDTDAGTSVGLQTLKPLLGALLWNRLCTNFHNRCLMIEDIAKKVSSSPLYERICWIASLPGGEEAQWVIENAERVVKTPLFITDDYPDGKEWGKDPRFLYYMYERASLRSGVAMVKWLFDSACMGYSFAIKELCGYFLPVEAREIEAYKGTDLQKRGFAICVAWSDAQGDAIRETWIDHEPSKGLAMDKYLSFLKRRVYQGGCRTSIEDLSQWHGLKGDRIASVFWTAASFASNNECRWFEDEDETLFIQANNFGGDRNPGVTLHAATTFVTLEKYQLAKCMFEIRQWFVISGTNPAKPFKRFVQHRGDSFQRLVEWYKETNYRARLAIDAWTIISWRFGVVKDIRRFIGNMLWADRHDWRF
jgi:hypothetical protein